MTESVVERVARALALCHCQGGGAMPLHADGRMMDRQEYVEASWPFFQFPAMAAVAAMREPSEAMCKSGYEDADHSIEHVGALCDTAPEDQPRAIWQAMIDAALSEPVPK